MTSFVDSEEFLALLQEMDRKYQVPHQKSFSRDQQDIQPFTRNNSNVFDQIHNH